MTMNASIAAIHQGSPLTPDESEQAGGSRLHDLDEQVQVGRVLFGDAGDARDEPPVDPGAQLDGGAVRADDDSVAARDRAALGVGCRRARSRPAGRWKPSSPTRSTNGPEKSGR